LIWGDFTTTSPLLKFNANVGIKVAPYASYALYVDAGGTAADALYGTVSYSNYLGVYGNASGVSSYSTRYGIYGYASGGTTNWAGYFSGNVYTSGTYSSSDIRLKKNISPLSGALKKVLSLQGVNFEWKSENELSTIVKTSDPNLNAGNSKFNFPLGTQIGVIAQDVENVIPEVVLTDADGLKSVDYVKIVPVLIEAIKEQQKQIERLTQEVEALKGKK
jgi:hypothetical protein